MSAFSRLPLRGDEDDACILHYLRSVSGSLSVSRNLGKAQRIELFHANDILRPWRTFCVNYEARTSTDPPRQMAKRRLKNYKLKHSRLLTCYSGLLYLLAMYSSKETVDSLPPTCATTVITAHVPHTLDVGSLRRNVDDSERASTKRFDGLCRFSFSILDLFGLLPTSNSYLAS